MYQKRLVQSIENMQREINKIHNAHNAHPNKLISALDLNNNITQTEKYSVIYSNQTERKYIIDIIKNIDTDYEKHNYGNINFSGYCDDPLIRGKYNPDHPVSTFDEILIRNKRRRNVDPDAINIPSPLEPALPPKETITINVEINGLNDLIKLIDDYPMVR